jgi:hypothetical protein
VSATRSSQTGHSPVAEHVLRRQGQIFPQVAGNIEHCGLLGRIILKCEISVSHVDE